MLAAVFGLTGCIDELVPEVGPLVLPACSSTDSDPDVDISYEQDLASVFTLTCARCHTPGGATPIGLAVGGLDLTSAATLRRGGARGGEAIITPGDPCTSVLVRKLGEAPPFGARMPLEGPPLAADVRQQIADWIAEGARGE